MDAADGATGPFTTVFTIVMENHDYAEIVGSSNAPYINSLLTTAGLATNYHDSGSHPSLPNYLTMISGKPFYDDSNLGLLARDCPPLGTSFINCKTTFPVTDTHLGTQLQTAAIPWRSYHENMGNACRLTASGDGLYAPKHNPFVYFTDMQGDGSNPACLEHDVDYSNFASDLAAGTYRYMWITPNLTNDGHDPAFTPTVGLQQSDTWASIEIPKILASAAYQGGGVIFLTWDEAEGRNGDSGSQIPMIILSPRLASPMYRSSVAYTHKSYLATMEDILGLPRLSTVTSEPSMMEFFK